MFSDLHGLYWIGVIFEVGAAYIFLDKYAPENIKLFFLSARGDNLCAI